MRTVEQIEAAIDRACGRIDHLIPDRWRNESERLLVSAYLHVSQGGSDSWATAILATAGRKVRRTCRQLVALHAERLAAIEAAS